jgi:hypothetical protein
MPSHSDISKNLPYDTSQICLMFCTIYVCMWLEPSPLLLRSFIVLLFQPWMIDDDDWGAISGMIEWQG